MADCYGCPFRWHDSDCEYCSVRNDEVIDYKNYSKESCPYYSEYTASKNTPASSPASQTSKITGTPSQNKTSYASKSSSTSPVVWVGLIVGIVALVLVLSMLLNKQNISAPMGMPKQTEQVNKGENKTDNKGENNVTYATVVTNDTGLNMRESASTEADVVDVIPKGATVEVLKTEDEWMYVKYKNQIGWCYSEYLSVK